jgi:alcohol dehydrogenase class IV
MQFEFATAARILFGAGKVSQTGELAAAFGRRALVVGGIDEARCQVVIDHLHKSGIETHFFSVIQEPTTDLVREGVGIARDIGCEVVIGFGGGSAVDTAKAIAALLTNPGDLYEYLEVIGKGKSLALPSAPFIAIPTTAGTGSEVTRNAVLNAEDFGVKVSLRSYTMLARVAIIDPDLTINLPPDITASTGLDALTQLIEPYVCNAPHPMVDALCRDGIRLAARSIRKAYEDGKDRAAREDMSLAALYSGFALANARLGAVHGFAGVLGGSLHAPHGAICARLLPFVSETNVRALKSRGSGLETLHRFDEVAQLLTGNPTARAEDGVAWIQQLSADLKIPPLAIYGLKKEEFPEVIKKSSKASSMKGNPVILTQEEMAEILERAT